MRTYFQTLSSVKCYKWLVHSFLLSFHKKDWVVLVCMCEIIQSFSYSATEKIIVAVQTLQFNAKAMSRLWVDILSILILLETCQQVGKHCLEHAVFITPLLGREGRTYHFKWSNTCTTVQTFKVVKRSPLCSSRLHLFDQKYSKNSDIIKYYY